MLTFFRIHGVPVVFRTLHQVLEDGADLLAAARCAGVRRVVCAGHGATSALQAAEHTFREARFAFEAHDFLPQDPSREDQKVAAKREYIRGQMGSAWHLLEERDHKTLSRIFDAGEFRDGTTLLCLPASAEAILVACKTIGRVYPEIDADAERLRHFASVPVPRSSIGLQARPVFDVWTQVVRAYRDIIATGKMSWQAMQQCEAVMRLKVPAMLRDGGFAPCVEAAMDVRDTEAAWLVAMWGRESAPVDIQAVPPHPSVPRRA